MATVLFGKSRPRDTEIGVQIAKKKKKIEMRTQLHLSSPSVPSPVIIPLCLRAHGSFVYRTPLLVATDRTGAGRRPVLCFHSQLSAHGRSSHPPSDRRAGGTVGGTPVCVCVCEIRRDKARGHPARDWLGRNRGWRLLSSSHDRRGTHARCTHQHTPENTPDIEIKPAKVTCQICIGRSTTGGGGRGEGGWREERKIERAGEM